MYHYLNIDQALFQFYQILAMDQMMNNMKNPLFITTLIIVTVSTAKKGLCFRLNLKIISTKKHNTHPQCSNTPEFQSPD